ncbi:MULTISPECIES: glycoside hydrolase family 99-like domain-containing protein [Saccharibacillus]|uniref:glycoside hydrolase family 99-like domain-containing protein n=1 Tax=Saccharibacillus TaxID=456492 RepID=UPI00123B8E86|nr:glycoside hydrolase family 99-like domain-containing protein [Saccharibacillus sp. WB 17]MWJ33260.1 glycosyltransferase [Saccharibacillus sp. WB 17]
MAKLILDFYEGEANYTDGKSIEDEMLKLAESGVYDVSQTDKIEWPFFYHFSPLRENILNWYPFSNNCSILEIGSGCGALTGLLCERASYVASVELTYQRAAINYARHKTKKNLEIFVGNLSNIKLDRKFDYIIVNGVLEYAGQFISGDKPHEQFLRMLSPFLNVNGVMLLAIENRLGMKYFAGAKEDHLNELFVGLNAYRTDQKIRTFSKTELQQVVENSELQVNKFYYPYPDYKFPEVIFTDEGFELVSLSYDVNSYDTDRYMLFDEIKMQKSLVEERAASVFANSFLVEISAVNQPEKQFADSEFLYTKINANRKKEYRIYTSIIKTDKGIKVKKTPLTKEAFAHLEQMKIAYDSFSANAEVALLPLEIGSDYVSYPYIKEITLENMLLKTVASQNGNLFLALLDKFKKMIVEYECGINLYSSEFHKAFGETKALEDLEFTRIDNIDMLFDNVFYDESQFTIFDYEWCLGFKLPSKFVVWRAIKEFYEKNKEVQNVFGIEALYERYKITPNMVTTFYEWEKHFSLQYVGMLDKSVYRRNTIYLEDPSKMFNKDSFQANLYVDTGQGFNEKEKIELQYEPNETGEAKVEFKIGAFKDIKGLRFDPLEGAVILCTILSSNILSEKIEWKPHNSFAPRGNESDEDLFLDRDPIYINNFTFVQGDLLMIHFKVKKLMDEEIHSEIINRFLNEKKAVEAYYEQLIFQKNKNILAIQEKEKELLEQTLAFEEEKASLENQLATLESDLKKVATEYEVVIKSKVWLSTKPIRASMDFAKYTNKRIKNNAREGKMLVGKVNQNFKNHGVKKTLLKINSKAPDILNKVRKSNEIAESLDKGDAWEQIKNWVENTPHDFIDIFHVPMGWHTPLFQRFQHLSLQAGGLGGISFYGAHPLVDKDIEIYKFITPTLCIINLDNYEVKRRLFEFLDQRSEKRVIRLQSIDLATTKEELEAFLNKGYKIVYEYIDEITPQITGSIPQFVLERHDYTMRNEEITVIATSDKLFDQVKPYRDKNMEVITNGVDLSHWAITKDKAVCPADIREIVESGKVIIGYHGALAQWIDYEVLAKLASDQRFSVLIIGYEHDDSLQHSGILNLENIHFIGSKPYEELNRYAVFYDIAILPFLLNDITKSVSPVKIFEYMALKKPIVTYALPECLKYDSCLIAHQQDEFIEQVQRSLDLRKDATYLNVLEKEALENTWQRVAELTFNLAFNNNYAKPMLQKSEASENQLEPFMNDLKVVDEAKPYIQEKKSYQVLKNIFWNMPLLPDDLKTKMMVNFKSRYFPEMLSYNPTVKMESSKNELENDSVLPEQRKIQTDYIEQVLSIPNKDLNNHVPITKEPYVRENQDSKIIAYYLTQFHPDKHNEIWWGKGVTEWDNVARAVPQYIGHYQPRLPGELGFYDLRLRENMERQIELAKMYGVYGFSFYYYWFDGERLLEKPIEMFLEDKSLDFPFSLCWANENWTKRFDGTNSGILMEQPKTVDSYKNVIHDMIRFLKDPRYIEVQNKKVLTIYRPSLMPEPEIVIQYWREFCLKNGAGELYLIAVKENMVETDLLSLGYDALSEFHPGTLYTNSKNITPDLSYARTDFAGEIFDYKDLVENQKYFNYNYPKLYRAVMPMWDNTARRNNKGMIFHGATPALYKRWLKDVMLEEKERMDLDDELVFINAWNEWGEGTYLEPDKKYGYAYLQATKDAVEEMRSLNKRK